MERLTILDPDWSEEYQFYVCKVKAQGLCGIAAEKSKKSI